MITIRKDRNQKISYEYDPGKPVVKGQSNEEFIYELAVTIDSVLRQAEPDITGVDPGTAWNMLISCVKNFGYPGINQDPNPDTNQQMENKQLSYNYFLQYADYMVPGVIREIEKKYGRDYLSECVTKDDMLSSIDEKVTECAWLYMGAREKNEEDLMFAYAKQLFAARNNSFIFQTVLSEMQGT